jgi:hypothetical protein
LEEYDKSTVFLVQLKKQMFWKFLEKNIIRILHQKIKLTYFYYIPYIYGI